MMSGVPHYVIMAVDDNDEVRAGFEVPGAQDTLTFLNVIRKLKDKVWDAKGALLEDAKSRL